MNVKAASETQKQFIRALEETIHRFGSQDALAKKAGVSQPTISDLLTLKKTGSQSTKEKIAEAAGYSLLEFLALGRRLISGFTSTDSALAENRIMHVSVGSGSEKEFLDERTEFYRGVPLYESGKLAAGTNGLSFDPHEAPTSTVIVYQPELKRRANHKLAALRVGGDSMEPTIPMNSMVVVDLTDREFTPGKLYVVNFNEDGQNTGMVKRVYKWAKGFTLVSDNSSHYPPVPTEMDWIDLCVGRVIWMWRNMEDL